MSIMRCVVSLLSFWCLLLGLASDAVSVAHRDIFCTFFWPQATESSRQQSDWLLMLAKVYAHLRLLISSGKPNIIGYVGCHSNSLFL